MAVLRRLPDEGLLAHSDHRSQQASEHYRRILASHGRTCNKSRRANCWNNTLMESFFASLRKKLVHDDDYQTKASLFEYIEGLSNQVRRHFSLGYWVPSSRSKPDYLEPLVVNLEAVQYPLWQINAIRAITLTEPTPSSALNHLKLQKKPTWKLRFSGKFWYTIRQK